MKLNSRKEIEYDVLLEEIRAYLLSNSKEYFNDISSKNKELIRQIIIEYIDNKNYYVVGENDIPKKVYQDLVEFSFLTDYLYNDDIEEININSYNIIKLVYADGHKANADIVFKTPEDAVNIISKMLQRSNNTIDISKPMIVVSLNDDITVRITACVFPVVSEDRGVTVSIRKLTSSDLTIEDIVELGTCSKEMIELLINISKANISHLYAGATSSGKTTLLNIIGKQIDPMKRKIVLEQGTSELNFDVDDKSDVVYLKTRKSNIESYNIDLEDLVELSMTLNPELLIVGEIKSYESYIITQAGNTGHMIMSTIHANNNTEVYERISDLANNKYNINVSDFSKQAKRVFPIVVYCDKNFEGKRIIREITETVNGEVKTLFKYDDELGFIKVNDVSQNLLQKFSQKGLCKNFEVSKC